MIFKNPQDRPIPDHQEFPDGDEAVHLSDFPILRKDRTKPKAKGVRTPAQKGKGK